MESIEIGRAAIDAIDQKLLELFLERMDWAQQIGEYKRQYHLNVTDMGREKEIIDRLLLSVDQPALQMAVAGLWDRLFSVSRDLQATDASISRPDLLRLQELFRLEDLPAVVIEPTVSFPGTTGSYSDEALSRYFPAAVKVEAPTFAVAMQLLMQEAVQLVILPIENSSTGSIGATYDLLVSHDCYLVGEIILPIHHCLLAPEGADCNTIREVYSHQQGFSQCRDYLHNYPDWQKIPYFNTAIAARKVAESQNIQQAAIASSFAAFHYKLQILAENIEDQDQNQTRFAVVGRQLEVKPGSNRISLLFEIEHQAGSLYEILSIFAHFRLNLCKLESRPIGSGTFRYRFFADLEGDLRDIPTQQALFEAGRKCNFIKLLGAYSAAQSRS